jgi:hypothetical protein
MLPFDKDVQKPAFQFDNSTIETTNSASGTAPDELIHLESNIPVLQDVRSQNPDPHGERSISSCPVEGVGDCIQFTDSAYISNMIQMRQINIKHCSPPIKSPQKLDQVQGQSYRDEDAQTAYSDQCMTSYTQSHIIFTDPLKLLMSRQLCHPVLPLNRPTLTWSRSPTTLK